jgi:hypothetical protein
MEEKTLKRTIPEQEAAEVPEQPVKSEKKLKNRVIWLFSSHDRLLNKAVLRLLDNSIDGHDKLRRQLGLGMDQTVLAVYPYSSHRIKKIKGLLDSNLEDFVFLFVANERDQKDEKIKALFDKQHEAGFVHPSRETDYHIAMMGTGSSVTYKQVQQIREEKINHLSTYFKQVLDVG